MTNIFLYAVAGIYGLIMGSFFNVVALRDGDRKSIVSGRSRCPRCGHELSWFELVPLFSFLALGGRCRSCKEAIGWRYPLVELAAALITLGAFHYGFVLHGSWVAAVGLAVAGYFFLVVSLIDFVSMELPVEYVVVAGAVGGATSVASGLISWQDAALGLVSGAGVILAIMYGWKAAFKKDGMGEGDAWLAGALGAIVGYPLIFVAIGMASVLGSVVGVIALSRNKANFDSALPFGPFLFLGAAAALAWGQQVLGWYILYP